MLELKINKLGLLTNFSNTDHRVRIHYDDRDQVRRLKIMQDGKEYEQSYAYGRYGLRKDGNYVSVDDGDAHSLEFSYDPVSNLTGLNYQASNGIQSSQTNVIGDADAHLISHQFGDIRFH